MARFKNFDWNLSRLNSGNYSFDTIKISVLMDIRDELQTLNSLLHCHNFTQMPTTLHAIRRNTMKRKRVKK